MAFNQEELMGLKLPWYPAERHELADTALKEIEMRISQEGLTAVFDNTTIRGKTRIDNSHFEGRIYLAADYEIINFKVVDCKQFEYKHELNLVLDVAKTANGISRSFLPEDVTRWTADIAKGCACSTVHEIRQELIEFIADPAMFEQVVPERWSALAIDHCGAFHEIRHIFQRAMALQEPTHYYEHLEILSIGILSENVPFKKFCLYTLGEFWNWDEIFRFYSHPEEKYSDCHMIKYDNRIFAI
jgi:hypothetical protein